MVRKPDVDATAVDALLQQVFGTSVTWQRTLDGVSAQVYRVLHGPETFYLRIAEEPDDNLQTDAELHQRLRDLGVRVAEPIHVEPFNAGIGRSTMITTEVPGTSLAETPTIDAAVVEAAGADLAVLNQQPVDGFGWVRRRGRRWPLHAEYPSYAEFATSYLPSPWPGPLASLFATPVLDAIEVRIEHERHQPYAPALLTHGDFDLTQIFCADGRYTGLIDFSEIRGAERLFDLGHFYLHDQAAWLPALLTGYQRVQPLPADHLESIRRSAILLALRQLCRWLGPLNRPPDHPAVIRRTRRISQLVAQP
ncbi:phosphotransferase family protein [Allorhizocola rhizosphaerae]|uniref:phosphotransferase family protein n=1 Tax=Allorhizocola rhizosphaerae TaxID=1872709 RepID=UPI0013C31D4C|nr:phosphotransferase [Allorhizocola rhizosphaerae]